MKNKNVIYILLIILLMISIVPKEMQNDTFFTIAGGRLILENGIQKEEQLVWHKGLEFTNSRWLFDILITLIYQQFDFLGIYIFVICCSILQGLLFYYVLLKITNQKKVSFLITIISMIFLSVAFTARAQIISNILLLAEFYCLEKIKSSEKVNKKYIIVLMIIPILFANIHASTFPIYFVLFLPYFVEFILYKLPFIHLEESRFFGEVTKIKRFVLLFVFGILSGFIVPSGVSPYSDLFKVMDGISSNFIAELSPQTIFDNLYLTGVLFFSIAIMIFGKQRIRISDGLFILGFSILAMNNLRSMYYFILISGVCFTRIFVDFINSYNFSLNFVSTKKRKIIYLIIIIMLLLLLLNWFISEVSKEYVPYKLYPVTATNYIKNNFNINNIKIFNSFNFGSYLEFRGIKAFIDSRSGIFTEEFNPGCTVLKDWFDVEYMNLNYNEVFDKYQITHVLLNRDEPIVKFIKYDSKWNCIYQDDYFFIYERVNIVE